MNSNNSTETITIYNIPNDKYYIVISFFLTMILLMCSIVVCMDKLLHSGTQSGIAMHNAHAADSGY